MYRRDFVRSFAASLVAAAILLAAGPAALAGKAAVFTGLKPGVAVGGYDPVAYFTENRAVKGDASLAFNWNGAQWHFSSAENREAFKANPEKYAPQYGGYCAWAVSQSYTAKGEPEVWKIVDGKLYLNFSSAVQQQWEQDVSGNIGKADANWPSVLN